MANETLTQTLARNPMLASSLASGDALRILDVSASGIAKDAAITVAELFKLLKGHNASSNTTGDTTVTPSWLTIQHTEVITVGGSGASTRKVVLEIPSGLAAGARCLVRCLMPSTADITLDFRNESAAGTSLHAMVTDGSGDDFVAEFEFDGTAWAYLWSLYPATAYPAA